MSFQDQWANPKRDYWATIKSCAFGHYTAQNMANVANGKVILFPGMLNPSDYANNALTSPKVELWDPETNSFSLLADAPAGLLDYSITILRDGRIVISGGHTPTQDVGNGPFFNPGYWLTISDKIYIYTPSTNMWATAASVLPTPLHAHQSVQLNNGKVLFFGGITNTPFPPNSIETDGFGNIIKAHGIVNSYLWDPVADTIAATGSMAKPRLFFTPVKLNDGRIMAIGGLPKVVSFSVFPSLIQPPLQDSIEVYNPVSGVWSDGTLPEVAGTFLTMPVIPNDFSPGVIPPGYPFPGGIVFDNALDDRMAPGAAVLTDGTVLIIGGTGLCAQPAFYAGLGLGRASCLVVDPKTGLFTQVDSIPRVGAVYPVAVVSLRNGQILHICWNEGYDSDARAVHLFNQFTRKWELGADMPSSNIVVGLVGPVPQSDILVGSTFRTQNKDFVAGSNTFEKVLIGPGFPALAATYYVPKL